MHDRRRRPTPVLSVLAAAAAAAALLLGATPAAADVPDPHEHLGHRVGADFKLADWEQVSSYYRALGEASPRVLVERVGETTEGRDFLLAVISSEGNLARLDAIREANRKIADPRGLSAEEKARLVRETPVTLFISNAMHSNETAAPQFGMELAHTLATSDEEPWKTARERMVILVAPTLNPDGLDHIVSWYRRTVETPFEGSGMTKLYQLYAGHDNNRDWFGLTQNETRIVTRLLYSVWRPQVYWDVHQQGSSRERFFVPPFRDPLNPNLDPSIISAIDALGSRALFDMTRWGHKGVSTGVTYDMWWNGGNRNVPVRHNIIGLLTEAASVNYASPVFLPRRDLGPPRSLPAYAPSNRFPDPWPGGWWRMRDIVDYELAFGRSLIGSLSREPSTWLGNSLAAAERAVAKGEAGGPAAWIVPSDDQDRKAVHRLIDTLLIGGVQVEAATEAFEADGRSWPSGSLVIRRDQPYGAHVKDLMEVQRYPEGDPPYDVAGWTFPLLLGVRRVEVIRPFEVPTRPVTAADVAIEGFPDDSTEDMWSVRDGFAWRRTLDALGRGEQLRLVERDGAEGGGEAGRYAFTPTDVDPERVDVVRTYTGLPRIGVYAPWSSSMDEGWLRWVLDSHGVPYVRIRNEMIRAGTLRDVVDVLVIASIGGRSLDAGRSPGSVFPEFSRGLDPEGAIAVTEFVEAGGTLITLGGSSGWAAELFDLQITDVIADAKTKKDFSCPGSVLRGVFPEEREDVTVGLPSSIALMFSSGSAWRLGLSETEKKAREEAKRLRADPRQIDVLLRYAPTRTLLSGWIRTPEVIADRAAWLRVHHGEGRIHLFAFRPQYRGWSQGTFQLLFRAILDAPTD